MSDGPVFEERLTGPFAPDALWIAGPLLALGAGLAATGHWIGASLGLGLGVFTAAFFRNPSRRIPEEADAVVAPADGRVVAAGEIELPDGRKAQRVGIFLSVFNVHVNRAPVAGRVVGIERGGEGYLAAFLPEAEERNVRLALDLETEAGDRVRVVQITGWIARRIVCHAREGEWLRRGVRYGLIRFGSRTDVVLPARARLAVKVGQHVRGGAEVIAHLGSELESGSELEPGSQRESGSEGGGA